VQQISAIIPPQPAPECRRRGRQRDAPSDQGGESSRPVDLHAQGKCQGVSHADDRVPAVDQVTQRRQGCPGVCVWDELEEEVTTLEGNRVQDAQLCPVHRLFSAPNEERDTGNFGRSYTWPYSPVRARAQDLAKAMPCRYGDSQTSSDSKNKIQSDLLDIEDNPGKCAWLRIIPTVIG